MEFKVIKLDRKRNNVVLSRRAVVEASMGEERAKLLRDAARRRHRQRRRQEHHRVRRVRRPRRHRRPAAHHRHGLAPCASPERSGARSARNCTAKVLKFDAEKNRVSLGLKQLGDDPWIGVSPPLPATARACSARSPTSPTTARSSRSSRASKAWCTSPRWTGPTRTSPRPRSSRWATKSKSWSSRSTKTSAASAWA